MIVLTDYYKTTYSTPIVYRVLEGITTFSMPLGFWMGGGQLCSFLFLFYMIHGIASFFYHVFPNSFTYWFDISFIHLIVMERGYRVLRHLGMLFAGMVSMSMETVKTNKWIPLKIMAMCCWSEVGSYSYLCKWMISGIFYYASFQWMLEKKIKMSSVACMCFHLILGVLAFDEVQIYKRDPETRLEHFLRYCFYLWFVFYMVVCNTENSKRLRSVLTLTSSIVLTPLSFYQLWCQLQSSDQIYYDDIQPQTLLFYLSYVAMDIVMGLFYYPMYFTPLEGWFHHLGTAVITLYYLDHPFRILYCMNQIIETSTIFLSLFKIFYDVPWLLRLRDQWFCKSFILFRVVLPTLIMAYFHTMVDYIAFFIYSVHMSLNLYWLCRISQKK